MSPQSKMLSSKPTLIGSMSKDNINVSYVNHPSKIAAPAPGSRPMIGGAKKKESLANKPF